MPRETDDYISLSTYQKHWIHTRPYGHDIVIWCDTGKITIQCIWPDKRRDNNGRVEKKKSSRKTSK